MADSPWLESSNFVARFHALQKADVHTSGISLLDATGLPQKVSDRLNAVNLTWANLPILAQRALLWDMGLVLLNDGSSKTFEQVYTTCDDATGISMANIMLSKSEFLASDPTATILQCTDHARQQIATAASLVNVVKCAIPNNTLANSFSSMWAQDGSNNPTVPSLRILAHRWSNADGTPVDIMAIHALPDAYSDESSYGSCPQGRQGSLIVPCKVHDQNQSTSMCIPAPSLEMTQWLTEISQTRPVVASTTSTPTTNSNSSSSTTVGIVLGVVGGVLLLAGVFWFFWRRRRRPRLNKSGLETIYLPPGTNAHRRHDSTIQDAAILQSVPQSLPPKILQTDSRKLNDFQRDSYLTSRRVPYSAVASTRLLSKGAYGEVWLGTFNGETVAIKKILDSLRSDETELECFADEIRLMASFHHPHIVAFKGFAWNTLPNMCCIVEFMRNGDLGSYLVAEQKLNWDAKLVLAVGIARALAYLHALTPKIIHRDLKAKNVLVSDDFQAKLSDFGISRIRSNNETMTAGVGTVYWTAPEVLNGDRYSELADMYSFGCVLNELDTHDIPYAGMKGVTPMTVVQGVTVQGLRPAFKATCPKLVKDLADQCLAANPKDRPTAAQVVNMIELWKGW
ncbi:unnamed protein product [Aphanomyces euteiches]